MGAGRGGCLPSTLRSSAPEKQDGRAGEVAGWGAHTRGHRAPCGRGKDLHLGDAGGSVLLTSRQRPLRVGARPGVRGQAGPCTYCAERGRAGPCVQGAREPEWEPLPAHSQSKLRPRLWWRQNQVTPGAGSRGGLPTSAYPGAPPLHPWPTPARGDRCGRQVAPMRSHTWFLPLPL